MSSAGNGSAEGLSVFDMDANGKVSRGSDGTAVVRFADGERLVVVGAAYVRVLSGAFRVCGYRMLPLHAGRFIASPWWSPGSLLTLEPEHGTTQRSSAGAFGDSTPAIKLTPVPGASDTKQIANTAGPASRRLIHGLRAVFASTERAPLAPLSPPADWTAACAKLAALRQPAVVVVVGERNAGKSTLCRLLVNTMLGSRDSVAFLDTDLGQSEFAPPGLVSLAITRRPLLAPPQARMAPATRWPARLHSFFVGDNQTASSPDTYLSAVRAAASRYRRMRAPPPLIVNTQGWIKGLGLALLLEIIKAVRPTHILGLSPHGRFPVVIPSTDDTATPVLLTLPPRPARPRAKTSASQLRQLALARYFIGPKASLLTAARALSAQAPYRVPWSAAAVCFASSEGADIAASPRHVLSGLNASLIGLCVDPSLGSGEKKDDERLRVVSHARVRSRPCVGLAIVRGIDVPGRAFLILTPVPRERLAAVNVLVRGRLQLPAVLLAVPGAVEGSVPYVTAASIKTGSASAMNSRRNIVRGVAGGAGIKAKT